MVGSNKAVKQSPLNGDGSPVSEEEHSPNSTLTGNGPAPSFTPLKATATTASARMALQALENFHSSPENPKNWSNGKKWRISLTVALTGFISTCGSSIGVPGIHAVRDEFGVGSEKVGILITTFYVLGLGQVVVHAVF